jgi:hypothetical protein
MNKELLLKELKELSNKIDWLEDKQGFAPAKLKARWRELNALLGE